MTAPGRGEADGAATREQARQLLTERCATLPDVLTAVLAEAGDPALRPDLRLAAAPPDGLRRFVVTGIGASEGPARLLAHLLSVELGLPARFVPLSTFAAPPARVAPCLRGAALLAFSQGLSPNARLLLAHAGAAAVAVLWTSARPDAGAPAGSAPARLAEARDAGLRIAVLPPACEDRLFLRVQGPAAAQLAAVQFAQALAAGLGLVPPRWVLSDVPDAVRSAAARARRAAADAGVRIGAPPLAILASQGLTDCCHGLRWKLLEGLGQPDPPVWDALLWAHGPLQQIYLRAQTLVALSRPDEPLDAALLDRLAQILIPARHRLLRLASALPGPLSLLDHDAQLNALVLDALAAPDPGSPPWDGLRWPAQGADGPLYDIAAPLGPEPASD